MQPTPTTIIPSDYHVPKGRQAASKNNLRSGESRPFIAWDGEGIDLVPGKPQSYVLFGCSAVDVKPLVSTEHLHTFTILDYICDVGEQYPDAFHVGFAFSYDVNMILRSLDERKLRYLHKNGYTKLQLPTRTFTLRFNPGKSFSVSRTIDGKKTTVRIDDMFTFFAKSFKAAYKEYFGKPLPTEVDQGKDRRGQWTIDDMPEVERYWQSEILCMKELAEKLRELVYSAEMRITQWHGPGALASFANKKYGTKKAMAETDERIRGASRYAYAGGRFELFRVGRFTGPIYSYDINSAYPYGISQLPNLATGEWVHRESPDRVARFGVYRISHLDNKGTTLRPGPVFHRDPRGNVTFPHWTIGWYWSPEAAIIQRLGGTILEGWELQETGERPFEWVGEMYLRRKQWKREGIAAEKALKLLLNSLYGKMAQRIGWDEKQGRIPPFHQLEWAGWVTSNTRAALYEKLCRIPSDALIAVETDGFYTSLDPSSLQIVDSAELGGWEVSNFDEILYVQSGLAWLRDSDGWRDKRRGLDAESFPLEKAQEYLQSLGSNQSWEPFKGSTHRFVGMGAAFMSTAPFRLIHCRWITTERSISPSSLGSKRVHFKGACDACKQGLNAYEMPHSLAVNFLPAMLNPESSPHDIPWDKSIPADWRRRAEMERHMISHA